MESQPNNLQRFKEEGIEFKTPLPAEYERVIEGLAPEEVAVIISVKQRLDEAQALTAPEVGPYSDYVLGPIF
jgi:hypothetical protein